MPGSLLQVRGLKTHFHTLSGVSQAVDGVDLDVNRGEVLGVVGESGCGKSVTALSILRLVPSPPGRIEAGQVIFDDRDLLGLGNREMRRVRGNRIAMIFQEPMTSLNPVMQVGSQIVEGLRLHRGMKRGEAWEEAEHLLAQMEIPNPGRHVHKYPHQLSGGMRQRVMIAMALSCGPELLIADEPTTALDVTVQAQILELLNRLRSEQNLSIMMITHDLGVIAETADRVCVMYAGQIAEAAGCRDLFDHPRHPYTLGLLGCIPSLETKSDRLDPIKGTVPDPLDYPSGCRFHPRCPYAEQLCAEKMPELRQIADGHTARCHFAERF